MITNIEDVLGVKPPLDDDTYELARAMLAHVTTFIGVDDEALDTPTRVSAKARRITEATIAAAFASAALVGIGNQSLDDLFRNQFVSYLEDFRTAWAKAGRMQ
jgi:hypothetical protein